MPKTLRTLKILLWILAGLCVVTFAGAYALMRDAHPAGDIAAGQAGISVIPASEDPAAPASALPVLFDAPHFALTDQNGSPFDSSSLTGKVFVLEFIFTTCPGACPALMTQMAKLDKQITDPRIRFITISVDPTTDTPEILKAKAASLGADSRWTWLTTTTARPPAGLESDVIDIQKAMLIPAAPHQPGGHTTKMLLFDTTGHCRARFDYDDADQSRLAVAVEKLANAPVPN